MFVTYYLGHIRWPYIVLATQYVGRVLSWSYIMLATYLSWKHIILSWPHIILFWPHKTHRDTQAHASDHLDQVVLPPVGSHK
jgi:hypothetical protein